MLWSEYGSTIFKCHRLRFIQSNHICKLYRLRRWQSGTRGLKKGCERQRVRKVIGRQTSQTSAENRCAVALVRRGHLLSYRRAACCAVAAFWVLAAAWMWMGFEQRRDAKGPTQVAHNQPAGHKPIWNRKFDKFHKQGDQNIFIRICLEMLHLKSH